MLLLDLPGYGLAEAAPVPDTLTGFADAVRRTLASRLSDRLIVVAHSFGGYIALELLRTHPEIFAGLVLTNTRSEADAPEAREKRLALVKRVEDPLQRLDVEETSRGLLAPATWEANGDLAQNVRGIVRSAQPPAIIGSLKAMAGRADLTPVLSTIRVPTLVLWGEEDRLIPTAQTRSMVARIPSSRGKGIPKVGHLPSLEAPEEFNRAVAELLGRVSAK